MQDEANSRQVAVISGGATGHVATNAFVGPGLLSGQIWHEPESAPALETVVGMIRKVTGAPGAVLIVAGDAACEQVFHLAVNTARAEGFWIEVVRLREDRLGLGGTTLVEKIAGAAAYAGQSLDEVARVARSAAENIAGAGAAVRAIVCPATGKIRFALDDDEESGREIFDSAGARRVAILSADQLIDNLMDSILRTLNLGPADKIVALINDLGLCFSQLTMVGRRTLAALERRGLAAERVYAGGFVGSHHAWGLSICLMRADEEHLKWLTEDTPVLAWSAAETAGPGPLTGYQSQIAGDGAKREDAEPATPQGLAFRAALIAGCLSLVCLDESHPQLAAAAGRVLPAMRYMPTDRTDAAFQSLGVALQEVLGGVEGALYGASFLRLGSALGLEAGWPDSLAYGPLMAADICGVKPGGGTMVDALIPFAEQFRAGASLDDAVSAAEKGASKTGHPFATGAAIWLRAAVDSIR